MKKFISFAPPFSIKGGILLLLEEALLPVISELTKGGHEFHVSELSQKLQEATGMPITNDSARYIANQLVIKKVLERRMINPRLAVYAKRKGASLSASLTVQQP